MKKKRILMVTESSATLSGYGTYTKEVLTRLHNTGKFEIAELASYAYIGDRRIANTPWKVYPNDLSPEEKHNSDSQRAKDLAAGPINQFGAWRFERVCLDFKPDIVFDIRDPWMLMFENQSPMRKYFHWAIMPTCDSLPQQEEWIDSFMQADGVFSYCDWGIEALRKESSGLIKLQRSAPPGTNLEVFKPSPNKFEHRRKLGFSPDMFIVGTVMRNQRRKLFPDLMIGFNIFLERCRKEGNEELARRSFLYFHTSWPDVMGCWNLPRLIKEQGLGHKVLCTYTCRNCHNIFVSLFQDARTVCPKCSTPSASMPSVGNGLAVEQLNDVYNLFDVYVQYATNEGFGMPQVEAASAGIPVMSTDYSAMSDVVRKLNGFPIKVERLMRVVEEDAYKALPDNQDFADKLYKFATLSAADRQILGMQARKGVEEHYTWDKTAKIWEDYFDNVVLTGTQGKWDAPPDFKQIKADLQNIPNIYTHEEFVEWAMENILGENPSNIMILDMVRALNYEALIAVNQPPRPYNRQMVVEKFVSMVNNHNQCEQARCGMFPLPDEDYIMYANRNNK